MAEPLFDDSQDERNRTVGLLSDFGDVSDFPDNLGWLGGLSFVGDKARPDMCMMSSNVTVLVEKARSSCEHAYKHRS